MHQCQIRYYKIPDVKNEHWFKIGEICINIIKKYGGEARFVGGCIRNYLLKQQVIDIDIASTMTPDEHMEYFNNEGIKVIPTGIKHGTVSVLINKVEVQITTLRKDVKCYGRHADVEFSSSWFEDAKRRDFTFNAMYLSLECEIIDYFNGRNDLNNKLIKFIGDPSERIQEDFLRIIRLFRFASYIDTNNIDHNSLEKAVLYVGNLKLISGERIRDEILKIILKDTYFSIIKNMYSINVMDVIYPYIIDFSKIDTGRLPIIQDTLTRLSIIVKNSSQESKEIIKFIFKTWKIAKKERAKLEILTSKYPEFILKIKYFIYKFGNDICRNILHILYVERNFNEEIFFYNLSIVNEWIAPIFPINGDDIKSFGLSGEEVGKCLKHLEDVWISSGYMMKKSQLLELL